MKRAPSMPCAFKEIEFRSPFAGELERRMVACHKVADSGSPQLTTLDGAWSAAWLPTLVSDHPTRQFARLNARDGAAPMCVVGVDKRSGLYSGREKNG